jgi:hypothetical protein
MKTVNQNKAEVQELLETWIPKELDLADSAMNNYESFLDYTARLGYEMPVDSDDYFDFWNNVYSQIVIALDDYQNQN